jgi:hypothetical protein
MRTIDMLMALMKDENVAPSQIRQQHRENLK